MGFFFLFLKYYNILVNKTMPSKEKKKDKSIGVFQWGKCFLLPLEPYRQWFFVRQLSSQGHALSTFRISLLDASTHKEELANLQFRLDQWELMPLLCLVNSSALKSSRGLQLRHYYYQACGWNTTFTCFHLVCPSPSGLIRILIFVWIYWILCGKNVHNLRLFQKSGHWFKTLILLAVIF